VVEAMEPVACPLVQPGSRPGGEPMIGGDVVCAGKVGRA
jgi:hypothetical protein